MHKTLLSLAGLLLSMSLSAQLIRTEGLLYLFNHRGDKEAVSQFAFYHAYSTEHVPLEDTLVQFAHLQSEQTKLYLYKKYGECYGVGYLTDNEGEFASWRTTLLRLGFREVKKATFDDVDHVLYKRDSTLVQVMQEFGANNQQRYVMNIYDKKRMKEAWQ